MHWNVNGLACRSTAAGIFRRKTRWPAIYSRQSFIGSLSILVQSLVEFSYVSDFICLRDLNDCESFSRTIQYCKMRNWEKCMWHVCMMHVFLDKHRFRSARKGSKISITAY